MSLKSSRNQPPRFGTCSTRRRLSLSRVIRDGQTVLEEVHRIAKERSRGITLDSDITELGLDSLERMEILASLEDKFGGQFPESILPDLLTAREVVDAVRKHLGHGMKVAEREKKLYEVTDASNDFSLFPEYIELKEKLDFLEKTNLSHFFDEHESIVDNITYIKASGSLILPRITTSAQAAPDHRGRPKPRKIRNQRVGQSYRFGQTDTSSDGDCRFPRHRRRHHLHPGPKRRIGHRASDGPERYDPTTLIHNSSYEGRFFRAHVADRSTI